MPVPMEYRLASQDFDRFLIDVAEETAMTTRNQAYTTVQGVLLCFRRRLSIEDAIAFAQGLPAMLRALFVQDWDTTEPRKDTWDRAGMIAEVRQLRVDHNFSPDTSIRDVVCVIRRYVDHDGFERCLARLPLPARDFWSQAPYPPVADIGHTATG